jgi:hypothetical protein
MNEKLYRIIVVVLLVLLLAGVAMDVGLQFWGLRRSPQIGQGIFRDQREFTEFAPRDRVEPAFPNEGRDDAQPEQNRQQDQQQVRENVDVNLRFEEMGRNLRELNRRVEELTGQLEEQHRINQGLGEHLGELSGQVEDLSADIESLLAESDSP